MAEPRLKNPALVYLSSLGSETSKNNLRYTIDMIARVSSEGVHNLGSFPWHQLRREHVIGIMRKLQCRDGLIPKPSTLRLYLIVLKRIAEEAMHLDLMSMKDYASIKRIKAPTGSRVQSGRVLNDYEIDLLLDTCSARSFHDLRDCAMLGLMLFAGLRRKEVVSLKLADIDWSRKQICVIGKRNKERILPLKDNLLKMLARYVLHVRGELEGALFCRITKDNRIINIPLSARSVYAVVAKRARLADIGNLEPHDLRRTFATTLDRNQVSLKLIKELLGHSSINTTETYIYTDLTQLADALQGLSDREG